MKTLVGDGAEELIRRVFAWRGKPAPGDAEVTEILNDYRRAYQACWHEHSRPYDGVPELLGRARPPRPQDRRSCRTSPISTRAA